MFLDTPFSVSAALKTCFVILFADMSSAQSAFPTVLNELLDNDELDKPTCKHVSCK